MSLYNLLHGENPNSVILKTILGIDQKHPNAPEWPTVNGQEWDPYDHGETPESMKFVQECIEKKYWMSGRYRDIFLNEDGTQIVLYTRNGGGNRESYSYIFQVLSGHPNYIKDWDDDFDSTYAYISFSVPKGWEEFCKQLSTGEPLQSVSAKFQETIDEMKKMDPEEFKKDKRFKPVADILNQIINMTKEEDKK